MWEVSEGEELQSTVCVIPGRQGNGAIGSAGSRADRNTYI